MVREPIFLDTIHAGVGAVLALPLIGDSQTTNGFLNELRQRLAASASSGSAEPILSSFRLAQYQALDFVLQSADKNLHRCSVDQLTLMRKGIPSALAHVRATLDLLQSSPAGGPEHFATAGSNTSSESAGPGHLRLIAESDAVEIVRNSVAPLPTCRSLIETIRDKEHGWFDAFAIYLAWQFKTSDSLRAAIFNAEYSSLAAADLSSDELLNRLYAHATGAAHRLDRFFKTGTEDQTRGRAPATTHQHDKDERAALFERLAGFASQRHQLHSAMTLELAHAAERRGIAPSGAMDAVAEAIQSLRRLHAHLNQPPPNGPADLPTLVSNVLSTKGIAAAGLTLEESYERIVATGGSEKRVQEGLEYITAARALVCETLSDHAGAARHYLRALELLGNGADANRKAAYLVRLVTALRRRGLVERDENQLRGALELSTSLISHAPADQETPVDLLQCHGEALLALGKRRSDAALLDNAAVTFASAAANNNEPSRAKQADALLALAILAKSTDIAERALRTYDTIMKWEGLAEQAELRGAVHIGRGDALMFLTTKRRATASAEAAAAYQEACTAFADALSPIEWAEAQAKLGDACRALAEHAGAPDDAHEKALVAYESALEEIPRGLMPERRSEILIRIGEVYGALSKSSPWEPAVARSVEAYAMACTPELRAARPFAWADARLKQGQGELRRGRHRQDEDMLAAAEMSFTAALEVFDKARNPGLWSDAQHAIGDALKARAQPQNDGAGLAAAEAAYRAALEARGPQRTPVRWAATWNCILETLRLAANSGEIRHADIAAAIIELERAMELPRVRATDWLMTAIVTNLTEARALLAEQGPRH